MEGGTAKLKLMNSYEKGRFPGVVALRSNIECRIFRQSLSKPDSRIKGCVPAKSVGQGVADEIWKALEALGFSKQTDYHSAVPGEVLENRVKRIRLRKQILRPVGQAKPETRKSERTEYLRDPAVKAWVLEKAAGICELCGKPAPFVTDEGLPYLEHHHVIPLAEGGPDTVENSVALCPNCHRMCHAGKERTDARRKLLERVKRRGCTGN